MLSFRDAVSEDYARIARFPQTQAEQFFMFPRGTFPLDPGQLEDNVRQRDLPSSVLWNGDLAAYANLYDRVPGEQVWLGNVVVSPQVRGLGVGRFLIDTMKQRAREELGVRELHLVCHNLNTRALLLYYKQGFIPYDMKTLNDWNGREIGGIKMKIELDERASQKGRAE